WSAVGARTTESQTHRQMASGLSMPLGFKNGTDGGLTVAINAIKAASQPQTFLGVNIEGQAAAVVTRGNPNCHIVLRGGSKGPNYSPAHIAEAGQTLQKAGLIPAIMVDASHDNSSKKPESLPEVVVVIIWQVSYGKVSIIVARVEIYIVACNQPFPNYKEALYVAVSITDGCIDWPTTEFLVRDIHAA